MTGQPSLLVPTELTHSALPADVGARVVVGLVPLLMQSSQQATFPPLNISQALWVSLVLFPSISPLKDQAAQKSYGSQHYTFPPRPGLTCTRLGQVIICVRVDSSSAFISCISLDNHQVAVEPAQHLCPWRTYDN